MRLNEDATIEPQPAAIQSVSLGNESQSNHVYLYEDIEAASALRVIQQIRFADEQMRVKEITQWSAHREPLWLHIQSMGGEAFASFALADGIISLKRPVYSIIEGVAASGAGIVAVGCHRRLITPMSFFHLHSVQSWFAGNYEQFRDQKALLDKMMKQITAWYADRTDLSKKKIAAMLERETWLDANEALELGFVDEIFRGAL